MTNSTVVNILSWVLFYSALIQFVLTVWYWLDARQDIEVAEARKLKDSIRQQALGTLRLAWVRFLSAVVWIVVATVLAMDWGEFAVDASLMHLAHFEGRAILLVLVWLEILKIFTDRWTRIQTAEAIAVEVRAREVAAQSLSEKVLAAHAEVMSAIAVNTAKTEEAAQKADAAYVAANHVNEKLAALTPPARDA